MSNDEVDYSQYGIQTSEATYDRKTYTSFKIEEGSNVYRILPPIAVVGAKEIPPWNVGHAVHWGYKNSKKSHRPFLCIQKKDPKTKMITRRCPECDRWAALDQEYKEKLAALTKEHGEEKAKKKLKFYSEALRAFNRGFKIYVNAYNEKNEVGALGVNMTHFNLFKIEADKLQKRGLNVTALHQGAWFDFYREGHKTFRTDLVRLDDDSMKPGKVPVEVLKQLKNSARDLTRLFVELTEDQIAKLAASDGDAAVVDAIFSCGETEDSEETIDNSAAAAAARATAALSKKAPDEPKSEALVPEFEDDAPPLAAAEGDEDDDDDDDEPLALPSKGAAKPAVAEEDEPLELPKTRPVATLPPGASIASMDAAAFRALVGKK